MASPQMEGALGSVMGACVADSIGSRLEFKNHPTAEEVQHALQMPGGGPHGVSPGQVTDDGELTISLARALAKMRPISEQGRGEAVNWGFQIELVGNSYADWVNSRPFDIGNATRAALGGGAKEGRKSGNIAQCMANKAQHANMVTQANGSLMRCTPLAVFAWQLGPAAIHELAAQEASLSHPNPTIAVAEGCYLVAISHLIGHPGDREGAFHQALESLAVVGPGYSNGEEGVREVAEWLEDAREGRLTDATVEIGFVKHAFILAFHHLLWGIDYPAAIRDVIGRGGDTDTNGCIVGGLIGAAVGVSGIPEVWRTTLLNCDTTERPNRTRPKYLRSFQIPSLVSTILKSTQSYQHHPQQQPHQEPHHHHPQTQHPQQHHQHQPKLQYYGNGQNHAHHAAYQHDQHDQHDHHDHGHHSILRAIKNEVRSYRARFTRPAGPLHRDTPCLIRNRRNGNVLDVDNYNGEELGAGVICYPASGAANQQWRFLHGGFLESVSSRLVLDADTKDGLRPIVYTKNKGTNQKLEYCSDGTLRLGMKGRGGATLVLAVGPPAGTLQFTELGERPSKQQQWEVVTTW